MGKSRFKLKPCWRPKVFFFKVCYFFLLPCLLPPDLPLQTFLCWLPFANLTSFATLTSFSNHTFKPNSACFAKLTFLSNFIYYCQLHFPLAILTYHFNIISFAVLIYLCQLHFLLLASYPITNLTSCWWPNILLPTSLTIAVLTTASSPSLPLPPSLLYT